jgi:hypothetical protein
VNLDQYLTNVGLSGDPFAHTNADEEELLASYFVPPPYFSDVRGVPATPKSCVVFAPRGGGKSAQRRMLEIDSLKPDSEFLCVLYDRFPSGTPTVEQHIDEICLRLTVGVLVSLDRDDLTGYALPPKDRDFLLLEGSRLDDVSREKFENLVTSLKSDTRKAADWLRDHSGPVKVIVSGLLASRGIKIDPSIPWGPQVSQSKETPPLTRLSRHIELVKSLGFSSAYVLIDRLDETAATATSPKAAIDLAITLLVDLKVMELPGIAVKAFAWNLSHDHYLEMGGRSDRIREYSLEWSNGALQKMMARRLMAFSDERIDSLNRFVDPSENINLQELAAIMANGSPRDMIRFCARVVAEHLNSSANDSVEIHADAIWTATRLFAAEICEERAKKFMPDLLRLDKFRFTQNVVASDYLKISKQATGAKVSEWRRTSMVDKIAEVQDNRNRPQHLYAVVDPRLAIALRPSLNPQEVLEFYSFSCPHCGSANYCDETTFDCAKCQRRLDASRVSSLMSMATIG